MDQIVNEGIRLKLKIKRHNFILFFLLPHLIHFSKITRRTTQRLHQSIKKQRTNYTYVLIFKKNTFILESTIKTWKTWSVWICRIIRFDFFKFIIRYYSPWREMTSECAISFFLHLNFYGIFNIVLFRQIS